MTAETSAAIRQCTRCGATLSRYSPEPVCAICSHADEPSLVAGEWLSRPTGAPAADTAAVLHAWRGSAGPSLAETVQLLGMTQQILSQIENGRHTMSYELRQRAVSVLGISAEDLGLSPGQPRAELDTSVAIEQ